jgi:hypothetical protein
MPQRYLIIFTILLLPAIIIPLISLFTPYNLMVNPLILYSTLFSAWCAVGVDIYGTYFASKLNKKGGITK